MDLKNILNRKIKLETKIPEILEENESLKKVKMTPSFETMLKGVKIVEDFIKKNKRKVYGGMAINIAIMKKNPSRKIYQDDDFPDYDFYSPDPVKDLIEICNELHKNDFKYIQAREAHHMNTYKIKIELYDKEVADISYVWNRYYHMIPTIKHNNIHYVAPEFQIMDIYRAYTNPMTGWFKIEKYFNRGSILEDLYLIKSKEPSSRKFFPKNENNLDNLKKNIQNDVLKNNENIIIIGELAYNKFIKYSKLKDYKFRLINSPTINIMTNNFKNIIKILDEYLKNENIFKLEFHPFLELYGKSIEYFVDTKPLIRVYETDICQPYHKFNNFNIGSYHVNLLFFLSKKFRNKVTQNYQHFNKYNYMINNITFAREYWLKKYNKIGNENSLFQELISECVADEIFTPFSRYVRKIKDKKLFSYMPEEFYREPEEVSVNYIYPNKSGNPLIKNVKTIPEEYKEVLADYYPELEFNYLKIKKKKKKEKLQN